MFIVMGSVEKMVVAPMLLIYALSYSGLSKIAWSFKILFNSMSIESIFGMRMTFEPFYSKIQTIHNR